MRKYFLFILIIMCANVKAQNLALYFELIPEELVPFMNLETRKNRIDTISDRFLSMHTSNISTLSIKMMPIERDTTNILTVIKSVETVGTIDSSIRFYTTTWSKLPMSNYFSAPTYKDFYQPNDSVSLEEFSTYCIPFILNYKFDGETLVANIDPEKYLPTETFKKIAPAFTGKPVTYIWKDERWVLRK